MSFLKISDPAKRDAMVKEYLELKKNIRDNLLSERTGELELQTDLSKFYRPITETQKATAREITEGLKPIREGIEKLPQAITFPTTQPIGEASGREEEVFESFEGEEEEMIGEIAKKYINRPNPDETFGIREKQGLYYIGNKQATIFRNNIIVDDEKFEGTDGLWELITSKNPQIPTNEKDYDNYVELLLKTNVLHHDYDPNNSNSRSSKSNKWKNILSYIWHNRENYKKKYEIKPEGKGVIVIPSDPNALIERLDLLFASQEAGHTGVGNELVSICDELKRQGVLDTKTYKKINSVIKKMIVTKHGFKKRYAYGGSGIFDTIVNLLTRIFTSSAAKQIASSALDVGKSVAKEGAKKALDVGKSVAVDVGKKLVTKALTPKSKKILQKYTEPTTQDINTLIDGSAIGIQDLVKKLNVGMGIKVV